MKIILAVLVVLGICGAGFATRVNGGKKIFCARAGITDVRIQNCKAEPCTIKKGQRVPVEIDFSFQAPTEAKEVNFAVNIPYWDVPNGSSFGSTLAKESSCQKLKLSKCPAKSGIKYTLKSNIYVHPASQDTLKKTKTGMRTTSWTLSPTRRENSPQAYSTCSFDVKLNIVQ